MKIIANGIIYYPTHDFKSARRIQGFDKIGEAEHIQGNGHKFIFFKNNITGECAIKIQHPRDSQIYIFKNANMANQFYKQLSAGINIFKESEEM